MKITPIAFFVKANVLLMILSPCVAFSQNVPLICPTEELLQEYLVDHPEYQLELDAFETFYQDWITNHTAEPTSDYIIPVVFHVFDSGDPLDLAPTDYQIEQAICGTNMFLQGLDLLGNQVGSDTHIRLRLARKDPSGNETTGINRFPANFQCVCTSSLTPNCPCGSNLSDLNQVMTWDTNRFLNVYVVKMLISPPYAELHSAIGYSQFGQRSIFITNYGIKSVALQDISTMHTFVHELGHALSLYHVYEGGCFNPSQCLTTGDRVCDTPSCDSDLGDGTCNEELNDCPDEVGILPKTNIMTLTSCRTTFTSGQINRMHANLATTPNLWSESNLISCGLQTNYEVPPPISATVNSVSNFSCADIVCNGEIELAVTASADFHVLVNKDILSDQTPLSLDNLCSGTYAIVVTDELGCTQYTSSISIATIDDSFQAYADQDLDGYGTGTSQAFCDIPSGFSMVDGDCNDNDPSINPGEMEVLNQIDDDCDGQADDGLIPLNAAISAYSSNNCFEEGGIGILGYLNGGTFPLTLTINPEPIGTFGFNSDFSTFYINGLSNVPYSITIEDATGESIILQSEIQVPVYPSASITGDLTLCANQSTSALLVQFNGNQSGPYTFIWDENPALNGLAINALPGTHEVQITSPFGCSTTLTSEVIQYSSSVISSKLCYESGGVVDVELNYVGEYSPSSITSIPSLSWTEFSNNSDIFTSSFLGFAPVGLLNVTIYDEVNCLSTLQLNISNSNPLNVVTESNQPSCSATSDGYISFSVTGGVAGYSYHWNDIPATNLSTRTGLTNGLYECEIIDNVGCSIHSTFSFNTGEFVLMESTNLSTSCLNLCDGQASVEVLGGTGPVVLDWDGDGFDDGPSKGNLCAGISHVQAYDSNYCLATIDITTLESAPLSIDFLATSPSCSYNSDGSIEILASGGSGIYSYSWSQNAENSNFIAEDLNNGYYEFEVEDSQGCTLSQSATLETLPLQVIIESQTPCTCSYTNDGQIELSVSGGSPGYTYHWSDTPTENSTSRVNLVNGIYECQIIDNAGCSINTAISLITPEFLLIESENLPSSCLNICDGQASVEASGGTGSIIFDWDGDGLDDGPLKSNLCDGISHVQAYDSNYCLATIDITTLDSAPLSVDFIATSPSCSYSSDGSIEILASGGSGTYSYTWNQIANNTNSSSNNLNNGTYEFVIEDSQGCSVSQSATLETLPLQISILDQAPSYCASSCDGQATIEVQGAQGGLFVDWDNDGMDDGTSYFSLCPGDQSILVKDDQNCEETVLIHTDTTPFDFEGDHIYSGENWNGQTITFDGDLIIPLGDWPTFTDVNFMFAEGNRLIIEEGALTFFLNCNFSTCDVNWKGIWVQSFGNNFGSSPGNFFMEGGSIKYAEVGIWNPDLYVWDGPYESGNVQCTNVLFENNRTAVKAEKVGQADDENFVGPFAYSACEFVVNDEYNQHFTQPFQQHAILHLVKGNGFSSCSFKNEMSSSTWAERGRAIFAVDARFDVDDIDIDGNDAGLSTFEGFDIAIYNHIFDGQYNGMIIRESSFDKNRIGILSRGVCFHDIVRNSIVVGDNTGLASLDNEVIDREGIVIDGGGFFLLSENDITGNILGTPDAATIGIRIRDIVTGSEEVYNNIVSNCIYANLANGTNSVGNEGLRYECNHLSGSITDLLISEFPENANTASISPWQSGLGNPGFGLNDYAAANTFTPSPDEWHIDNEGLLEINYLFGSGANEEPTQITGLVNAPLLGAPNTCEYVVVDMLPNIGDLDQSSISGLYSLVANTKQNWLNSKYLYQALIDNGNTHALIDEVEFNWSTDVWATRSKLLNASPYVSASVLFELAFQTTKGFPQAVALEVFLSNPNVAMDKRFIYYLQEDCDFPSYMIELLQLLNNQSALRATIEENLAKNHMRFLDVSAHLIRVEIRNKSIGVLQLIALLDQMESLTSEFVIIDLLLAQKNKESAIARYQNIQSKIHFVPEMKNEFKAFSLWMDLVMSVNGWSDLSADDKSRIDLLAQQYYNTTAGKKAMGVLNTYFGEDHFIPPYYSGMSGNVRSFLQPLATPLSVQFMNAFPNPAMSFLEITLLQGDKNVVNEILVITNNQGKTIQTLPVLNGQQQFVIDTRDWASGAYQLQLILGQRTLETITIHVVH